MKPKLEPKMRKRMPASPIMEPQTIDNLREILKNRPRDLLLFDLAIQTGLRLKDLLRLKVKDLIEIKIGEKLPIADHSRNNLSDPTMNETVYRTFHGYLKEINPKKDDFLFKSRKGSNPLTYTSASHLVRKWFAMANLQGLSGATSLRKTWEFHYQNRAESGKKLYRTINPEQVVKPVNTATLQEAVYRELKQAILSGRILPGQRLLTEKIATQANVSETPVREALTRLEAGGFIIKARRKGYIVRELSTRDLREILKIRIVLETIATREALSHISIQKLQHLENIFQQYKQARKNNDIEKYYLLNKEFHHTIYSSAVMPTLKFIIDFLWDRMSPYLNLLVRECEDYDPRVPWECHRGMLDGIKKQDPEEVCKWLKEDLTRAAETLTRQFDRKETDIR